MKKILIASIVAFFSVLSTFAIPTGLYKYVDRSGRIVKQVLVDNSGKTLYVLKNDGTVLAEWSVTEETREEDGTYFVLRSKYGGVMKRNGWWRENGKVYMNLENWGVTLVREED